MMLAPLVRIFHESYLYIHPGDIIDLPDDAARTRRLNQYRNAFAVYQANILRPAMDTLKYDVQSAENFAVEWNFHINAFASCVTGAHFAGLLVNIDEYLSTVKKELLDLAHARDRREFLDYFDGTYKSTESTVVLLPLNANALVCDHKGKHFQNLPGGDAQYSKAKGYVAALETKAIRLGIPINGDIYFLHNEEVGVLGTRHRHAKTKCIRVDSPGASTQHSHPFPESLSSGSKDATHETLLANLIVECAVQHDNNYLGRIAKYLADVGVAKIVLNSDQKKLVRKMTSPCIYWG